MEKKVRVPRKLIKAAKSAERIELRRLGLSRRYPDPNSVQYQIDTLEDDGEHRKLGIVDVSGGEITFTTSYHDRWGKYSTIVGNGTSREDAKQLAYNISVEIAQKIADKNKVYLEDMTSEDELANEIAFLGHKRGRLSIFALSIIGGLALSISSLTTTGYVISSLTQSSSGLVGIFLFVIGLVGMFFSLRK